MSRAVRTLENVTTSGILRFYIHFCRFHSISMGQILKPIILFTKWEIYKVKISTFSSCKLLIVYYSGIDYIFFDQEDIIITWYTKTISMYSRKLNIISAELIISFWFYIAYLVFTVKYKNNNINYSCKIINVFFQEVIFSSYNFNHYLKAFIIIKILCN